MAVRHRRALIGLSALLVLTGGGVTIIEQRTDALEPTAAVVTATPEPQRTPAETKQQTHAETTQQTHAETEQQKAAAPKPPVPPSRAIAETRARLAANGPAIKAAPKEKYQAVDAVVDADGDRHVRFQRTHRGLPVIGGDFVVHSTPSGTVTDATVTQQRVIDVPATAKVSRAKAIAAAGLTGEVTARQVVDARTGEPALAWEVTGGHEVVIVDAGTAEVRLRYDTVHTADEGTGHGLQVGDVTLSTTKRDDGTWTLTDPARSGNTVRDALDTEYPLYGGRFAEFTDADNVWGDGTRADRATVAVDVLHGMAKTTDYLRDAFGRAGVAGDGTGVTAYVHHDTNWVNASWSASCDCAMFGNGSAGWAPFTDTETVAHELAHGLNRATAGLIYSGESGGLNEAGSDIFGTLVEFYAANPADEPDYLVGEKLRLDGTPLRWMDQPDKDGKSVSCWSATAKSLDPHYSSGIGNKFFYNLAVGSGASRWGDSPPCHGAAPVTGIGNDRAAQIWYRALTLYMVSGTDFAGARQATLRAAADLYGPDSTERATVDAAWLAAGVDGSQTPYGAPDLLPFADYTPAPQVGDTVRIQVAARDPQRQELTFSATNLPPGVSIDAAGLITGVPRTRGEFMSYIKVTDPDGESDSELMWWIVKGPPVVASVDPAVPMYLDGYSFANYGATFTDAPDYTDDTYKPLVVTGTGVPEGLDLVVTRKVPHDGSVTARIRGLPATTGSGTTVLTATDAEGNTVTASIPWQVRPARTPGVPVAVFVTGGDGTALVEWDRPVFTTGDVPPTGYVVRVSPGTEVRLPASARSHTLTGLDVRKAYTIGVRATSRLGDGAEKVSTLTPTGLPVSVSPAWIAHGKAATLSGRVLRNGATVIAGATATLEQRPAGKTTWTRVSTVKTDAKGVWRATVKPVITTAYRTRFTGAYGMWPATSGTASAGVRHTVTIKASTTRPKANKKIKISGTVKPARAGVTITLQRKSGSRWVTITTTKTTTTGAYAFSRAFKRGTWPLRVVVAGSAANGTVTSSTVTLKVK